MLDGKMSISTKKMEHMKKAYKFVDQNAEAENFWKDSLGAHRCKGPRRLIQKITQ